MTPNTVTRPLQDGANVFDVTFVEAHEPKRFGLFAAGRGGNPLRHLPLLHALAASGCTMIAPHFPMLFSAAPARTELEARMTMLKAVSHDHEALGPPIGIGHSIGAVVLLALAGAKATTFAGEAVKSGGVRFGRLALLAPPTDFFRRPGALAALDLPIHIRAGSADTITPPAQAKFLRDALSAATASAAPEIRIDDGAGHFSYMNELPPTAVDPHPDRDAFLSDLVGELVRFLSA